MPGSDPELTPSLGSDPVDSRLAAGDLGLRPRLLSGSRPRAVPPYLPGHSYLPYPPFLPYPP